MSKRRYDEASVVRALCRKGSINVNMVSKTIYVLKENTDVGNGSWGKIDYLCNYHGYTQIFSNTISKKIVISDNNSNKPTITKVDKREQKLNMAKLAKNAMKKAKQ